MDYSNLAKYWIEYQSLPHDSVESKKLEWAMLEERDLLYKNPKECFNFILEVLRQTDDEWVLANLAAGPLESLLAHNPYDAIEWVAEESFRNPKLKKILCGVWQNLMPDDVWQRLQKLMD
jgi:hypothetical protein